MLTTFFIGAFMGFACGVLGPDSERPVVAVVAGGLAGIALALCLILGAP